MISKVISLSLVMLITAPTQSDDRSDVAKGLDLASIERTSSFLRKTVGKMQALAGEGAKEGNSLKSQEYTKQVNKGLAEWKGSKVAWPVQITNVSMRDDKIHLSIQRQIQFKGHAVTLEFRSGDVLEDDEGTNWAKHLKKGDTVVLEGKVKSVTMPDPSPHEWRKPVIALNGVVYSKLPAKAKGKK